MDTSKHQAADNAASKDACAKAEALPTVTSPKRRRSSRKFRSQLPLPPGTNFRKLDKNDRDSFLRDMIRLSKERNMSSRELEDYAAQAHRIRVNFNTIARAIRLDKEGKSIEDQRFNCKPDVIVKAFDSNALGLACYHGSLCKSITRAYKDMEEEASVLGIAPIPTIHQWRHFVSSLPGNIHPGERKKNGRNIKRRLVQGIGKPIYHMTVGELPRLLIKALAEYNHEASRAAKAISRRLGLMLRVEQVPIPQLGSGDLSGQPACSLAPVPEWWPFRNQYLITIAAMAAVQENCELIQIGCVKGDDAHTDGSRDFVKAMTDLLSLQEGSIRIEAPAIERTATELVRLAGIDARLLSFCHSCHTNTWACGCCRGCNKADKLYREMGWA